MNDEPEFDNNDYDTEIDLDMEPDHGEDNLSDVEADAMTLASAGMGTDEDYFHGSFDDPAIGDQLLDMEMEDRIGGTGYLEGE